MATAPTTKEDIKDRIGQACSKITIEQLINLSSITAKIATIAYNKKINISNIY